MSIWDTLRDLLTLPREYPIHGPPPGHVPPRSRTRSRQPSLSPDRYSSGLIGQARIRERANRTREVGGKGSDLDRLAQQLAAMLQSSAPPMMSQADMMSQARLAASAQFNPQIQAIRQLMGQTRGRAEKSQVQVGRLFNQLAKTYKGDIKDTKKDFRRAKEMEKARAEDLTKALKENYGETMGQLEQTLKRLGIEQAGGEPMGELAQDLATYTSAGQRESATELAALGQEERGDIKYYRSGGSTARMEGTQRQADIEQQLNEFLQEQQGKIGLLKSQRQFATQQALAEIRGNMAEVAQEHQEDVWDKLIELGKLKMQIGRYNKSSQSGKPTDYGNGLSASMQYLTDYFTQGRAARFGPSEAVRYQGIVTGLLREIGQRESRGGTVSPQEAANLAYQTARRRGINPTVLVNAIMAYYGRF